MVDFRECWPGMKLKIVDDLRGIGGAVDSMFPFAGQIVTRKEVLDSGKRTHICEDEGLRGFALNMWTGWYWYPAMFDYILTSA